MPSYSANLIFLVETGFLHVGQAGLEIPTSGDLPALASQSAGIIGDNHHTRSQNPFDYEKLLVCWFYDLLASMILVSLFVFGW